MRDRIGIEMGQRLNTALLFLIFVALCVLLALNLHPLQSTATSFLTTPPTRASTAIPAATVTDTPITLATAAATNTPPHSPTPPATATGAPAREGAIYHPGDAITIVWPYKNQVWESAYWDQPSGGMFNELPGPGNRCSNPVNGIDGPLTATCSIPTDATPGVHTINFVEFSDYAGHGIAQQSLKVVVVTTPPPAAATSTATATDTTV